MKGYLLDTCICVFLFRDRYNVKSRLDNIDPEDCFISEITVAELKYGIECGGQKERETRTVRPRAANYLNRGGKVGGILYTVFGAIGTGVSASLSFAFFVWWLVTPHTLPLNMTALFFFLTLGFCGMLWYGCRVLGRYRLADRYMKLIGEKMYMEIEDLAARTGRSIRRVRKDVRKMLKSGMLPQGHLDPKQTTLVVNDETWEEYLKLEEQWETRRKLEEAKQ